MRGTLPQEFAPAQTLSDLQGRAATLRDRSDVGNSRRFASDCPAVVIQLSVTDRDTKGPRRTPASQSLSEAVEWLLHRWQLQLLPDDVVVAREL